LTRSFAVACVLGVAITTWSPPVANPQVTTVFFALAAFADSAAPRLSGLTFGITYDPQEFVLVAEGHCADFQLVTDGWPAPETGTALTWNSAQTGLMIEAAWFAGYPYSTSSTTFAIAEHPVQGATLADDSIPPQVELVSGFGVLGFGALGSAECPTGEVADGDDGGSDGHGDNGHENEDDVDPDEAGVPSDPGEDSGSNVSVAPREIELIGRRWSCLVRYPVGNPPEAVVLLVGEEFVEPARVVMTTDSTLVARFDELPDAATEYALRVRTGALANQYVQQSLTWRSITTRLTETETETETVSFVLPPGVLGYPIGEKSATLEACEFMDEDFRELLTAAGAVTIRKVISRHGEQPPTRQGRGGDYAPDDTRFRMYSVDTNGLWDPMALAYLLQTESVAEAARPTERLSLKEESCDDYEVYQTYYYGRGEQWHLQHAVDNPGYYGIGANYAWCKACACESRIGLIDREIVWHSEPPPITGDGISVSQDTHGTNMAMLAASPRSANDYVCGVTDGATVHFFAAYNSDDMIEAFDRAATELDHGDVVSISGGVPSPFPEMQAAIYELVAHLGIPLFAAKCPPDALYPGSWDQHQSNWVDALVMSVGGADHSGNKTPCSDNCDIYAPIENHPIVTLTQNPPVVLYFGVPSTPSAAVPLVAGAALLYLDRYEVDPAQLYAQLLSTAIHPGNVPLVSANLALGVTGILDIADVSAVGGSQLVTLTFRVTDEEGIDGFEVREGPTCRGPIDRVVATFSVGDPTYTTDGEHYSVSVSAPYMREYFLKLFVSGGGETAEYRTSAVLTAATSVTAPAVPTALTLVPFGSRIDVKWTSLAVDPTPPNASNRFEFWIYRAKAEDIGGCTVGGEDVWSHWYRAQIGEAASRCQPSVVGPRCWSDTQVVAGQSYAYKVELIDRQATGTNIVRTYSGPSAQAVAQNLEVSGIESNGASAAGTLGVSVYPNPVSGRQVARVGVTGIDRAGGHVGLVDASGRVVGAWDVPLGAEVTSNGWTLSLAGKLLPAAGVYRVVPTSGSARASCRMIVIDG